jgi:hypothetical protein
MKGVVVQKRVATHSAITTNTKYHNLNTTLLLTMTERKKKYKIGLITNPTEIAIQKRAQIACCVSAQCQQMVGMLLMRITCLEIKQLCDSVPSMCSKETGCGIYRSELDCTVDITRLHGKEVTQKQTDIFRVTRKTTS